MNRKLDIDSWNRKEHFLFFKQMQEPFFGITATIDCTKAYQQSKERNVSFFIYYLHKTLEALNAIESFHYRICNDEVIVFDRIDASATILREDTSFGFSLIEYDPDLLQFAHNAKKEIERVQNTPGLFTREFPENLIHFSSLPWVSFTSLSHARSFTFPDSCPKITFGKMTVENNKRTVPVSVHVHHALMDGYHTGAFFMLFQEKMNA
ncbi:MAG TPA: chloramphenicol acetyltransferase [Flavobacterium sp.]|jgi:chloramphenicol O-acetyltransferase type A